VSGRLDGLGVVLTRPRAAAEALARSLEAEGARVFIFPALGIESIAPTAALEALVARLPSFDAAIFVSANAVEHGLALSSRAGPWPLNVAVAAIAMRVARATRTRRDACAGAASATLAETRVMSVTAQSPLLPAVAIESSLAGGSCCHEPSHACCAGRPPRVLCRGLRRGLARRA